MSKIESLVHLLTKKVYPKKYMTGVTEVEYRFWQKNDLLNAKTSTSHSIIDILWVDILKKLSNTYSSLETIKNIQQQLFQKTTDHSAISPLINIIVKTIINETTYFLGISDKNKVRFFSNYTFMQFLQKENPNKHFFVNLGELIEKNKLLLNDNTNTTIVPKLNNTEIRVLELLRNQKYQSISIFKKNGTIDRIESKERIHTQQRIIDLINEYNFQNIEIKLNNGQIAHIDRTVKIKC